MDITGPQLQATDNNMRASMHNLPTDSKNIYPGTSIASKTYRLLSIGKQTLVKGPLFVAEVPGTGTNPASILQNPLLTAAFLCFFENLTRSSQWNCNLLLVSHEKFL